jgi:hypothetical protein
VEAEFGTVPEGFLFIGRCHGCGARAEQLLDLRPLIGADVPMLDRARDEADARFIPVIEQMKVDHRSCTNSSPRTLPPDVATFAREMEDRARASVEHGASIGVWVFLLRASGITQTISMHDHPSSQSRATRRHAVARRLTLARDLIRSSRDALVAAVVVADAWGTARLKLPIGPHRKQGQALTMVVATADLCQVGTASLRKPAGTSLREDRGPVELAPLAWSPLGGPSPLTDGLFADDPARPIAEEDKLELLPREEDPASPPVADMAENRPR